MKRILAFLLALAMGMTLFGCAESNKESSEPASTTGSQTSTSSTAPTESTPETTAPTEPDDKEPDSSEPTDFPSYTGTDKEAADARQEIVATMGDASLTNGQLQLYYWMGIYDFMNGEYGAYASLLGLDFSQPLDQQGPSSGEESWQEFFLEEALSTWKLYQTLTIACKAEGIEMSDLLKTDLKELNSMLEESAKKEGFDSVDQMIQADAGAGCTAEDYYAYTEAYYNYLSYIWHLSETMEVTQAQIDDYYAENEEEITEAGATKDDGDVYGVRHILLTPEGGTTSGGTTTWTEEEWAACRVKAQALLDQWAAGEATEESFAALANTHSTDPGSNTNGGLYENLDSETSFVKPFKDWYLEEGRQVGDYGLIATDYGYHLMYLSSMEPKWIAYCRDSIITDTISNTITTIQEANPAEVDYEKIVIAEVKLIEES